MERERERGYMLSIPVCEIISQLTYPGLLHTLGDTGTLKIEPGKYWGSGFFIMHIHPKVEAWERPSRLKLVYL